MFKNLQTALDQSSVDERTAVESTASTYVPPAEGPGLARLIGYIQLGRHANKFQEGRTQERVVFLFELVGQRHPPKQTETGPRPHIIKVKMARSLNSKANYFNFIRQIDPAGRARTPADLVLNPALSAFRVKVSHAKFKAADGKEITYATFRPDGDKTTHVFPPIRAVIDETTGEETGEYRAIAVPPALTSPKIFIWHLADKEQWDSIYIPDGEDGEKRNEWQDTIRSAVNFKGSPIDLLLSTPDTGFEDAPIEDAEIPF